MKTVLNYDGLDISSWIETIAFVNGTDPVALLALLKAESGLNPRAQRYGIRTNEFLQRLMWLERGDTSQEPILQALLNDVGYDISFGYGQQVVAFHYYGDHTNSLSNVLDVRKRVFENPAENIEDAARRLASCKIRSLDDTWLGAMVVYNAGSDRRNDPEWMSRWAGNVASYQSALNWAESFREEDEMSHGPVNIPSELWTFVQKPQFLDHLNQLWGLSNELDSLQHEGHARRLRERIIAIKELFGFDG